MGGGGGGGGGGEGGVASITSKCGVRRLEHCGWAQLITFCFGQFLFFCLQLPVLVTSQGSTWAVYCDQASELDEVRPPPVIFTFTSKVG